MNTQPRDEFDGIFDDLSTRAFGPLVTTTFPIGSIANFDEFVDARLQAAQLAFALAPNKSLTHAALSNGRQVRQLVPSYGNETTIHQYLDRITLHARDMQAHSFFFCRITESTHGFCVLWVAHHVTSAEQLLRSGIIPIKNGKLGEVAEAIPPDLGPKGEVFIHVLQ